MFIVLLLTSFTIYLMYELYWKRRNFPRGPCPVPVFGNLLALNNPPPGYEAFERWRKEYGDVYTFWIGSTPHVVMSSYEKIKETFVRDADTYINKTRLPSSDLFRGGEDFGFGKNLMQEKILLEVQEVFSKFDDTIGSETEIPPNFDNAVANVINQLLFGFRFDETRQELYNKLKSIINTPEELFGKPIVFLAMNVRIIEKILPDSMYQKPFKEFRDKCFSYFGELIGDRRKEIDFEDLDSESLDYVEAYLKEQRKREIAGDTESFSDVQLSNICLDLWFAGLSTTRNTITWAISFMLHHPEIQQKVHEESSKVIGSDRLITTADKNNLPYMNAFINETQRCVNLVPLNTQHATTRDTVINGYRIPKGTGVIAQISTVLNDETVFPDHKSFKPERFIDEEGKLKKVEELIPFSTGKRQCLGEGLARMELFLFISNFFNRYEVSPSKEGLPSLDKSCVSRIAPRMFSAVLRRRDHAL
ncbi:unnamed protein product [Caenorhabditis brenneri]